MTLEELRQKIDDYDAQLIDIVAHRLALSKDVAAWKKENRAPLFQPEREEEIFEKKAELMKEKGIDDPSFVRKFFSVIIEKSIEIQKANGA